MSAPVRKDHWVAETQSCVVVNGTEFPGYPDFDCCHGGWFQPVDLERSTGLFVVWLLILCWIFLGVAMGAEVFMSSIEQITSKEVTRKITTPSGKVKTFHVRVWNETVANLTLMALGSSAPEILINVLEVLLNDFYPGQLGPSTIVGSAAFNLMVITAVCVIAIPEGDFRTMKSVGVFYVTASYSVVAYLWLLLVVVVLTPNIVTIWEAVGTCLLLASLIVIAYIVDKRSSSLKMRVRVRGPPPDFEKVEGRIDLSADDIEVFNVAKTLGVKAKSMSTEQMAEAIRELMPAKHKAAYRRNVMENLVGPRQAHGTNSSSFKRSKSARHLTASHKDIELGSGNGAAGSAGALKAQSQSQQQPGSTKFASDGSDPSRRPELRKSQTSPNIERMSSPGGTGSGSGGEGAESRQGAARGISAMPRHRSDESLPPAGMIRWVQEAYSAVESCGTITLLVERVGGFEGAVTVDYATKDQQARAHKDYEPVSGKLSFADGESGPKPVVVAIFDDDQVEKDETFTVVLSEASAGAIFDVETDGGESTAICTVTIVNDDDRRTRFIRAMQILKMDIDQYSLETSNWAEQIQSVFTLRKGASVLGHTMHLLSFPWRLLFALVPPPGLCGGWPCFVGALIGIALQVILISDFALQMGCHMGIKPDVTAITFVALGTSLPDLFASKQAAIEDKTADNSIGNVTGSNSVNVFFGLGFPWLLATIVWLGRGATPEWKARYPQYVAVYPEGGFIVESAGLGLSVGVFVGCAVITIVTVLIRRPRELGGNKRGKWLTFGLFITLWVLYILMSILSSYQIIG